MSRRPPVTTLFLREFCTKFETTGAVTPSTRYLARAITRHLRRRGPTPIRVLDCGPGTGAFTDRIVEHLRPGDVLDVVEINDAFVRMLQRRFATEPRWQAISDFTNIHNLPFQNFDAAEPYDFIISGLPHSNFPAITVAEILHSYTRLLKPGGALSYVEYLYLRQIRKTLSRGSERVRVSSVEQLMLSHMSEHQVTHESVLRNVPPARVHHLTAPAGGAGGNTGTDWNTLSA
ncbi:hypothetical protein B1987_22090 [Mycobacterium kansasii]|uniref:Ubiquinone/menaquinone biosynthesis C-methyltransferase UbiE n=1 Tax=Mycobacterium attenuatum TaxID=2341086 RepID=A0A498PRZ0_9MYCO|nr:methyltransferase domain-containing protein [Mycobacterium attenuatum]ORB86012.1 hypothetical protein B1987_22090 [Mycobacterium kansasii]VBA36456.1 Ubiquinone/menaquinone biosynthesis C-methyltransferase UbiE [Mycobacterium attenuatum]